MTSLRFGFVGWNPFQFRHALDIARALPGSAMIVEARARYPERFDEALVTEAGVPVYFWPRERMRELDGIFDVLVCQTVFTHIEHIRRSKIAMLQYGLAKDPHNYGEWRAFADLCLTYGPYSSERIAPLSPTAEIGHPRFDRFFDESFQAAARAKIRARHTLERPAVLYVPTWGPLSTQDEFLDAVLALSSEHDVLLKLHHNTDLIEPDRRALLESRGVQFLGASDDLIELLAAADVVLSDYSGAIFDALLAKKPVALLQKDSEARFGAKLDAESLEYAARDRIGPVVEHPRELREVVDRLLRERDGFAEPNAGLLRELYAQGGSSIARAVDALERLARGESEAPTPEQLERRERVRAERIEARVRPKEGPIAAPSLEAKIRKRLARVRRKSLRAIERAKDRFSRSLRKRATSYVNDARPRAAHALLTLAARLETRGLVRKLALETREGWLEDGERSLMALLALDLEELRRHLGAIQRASPLYPRASAAVFAHRRLARARNLRFAFKTDKSVDIAIRRAIDGRWLGDALALRDLGARVGADVSEEILARLGAIVEGLGPLARLIEPAQRNERPGDTVVALEAGELAERSLDTLDSERTVEFFIPTAFFAYDSSEKEVFGVVRGALRALYESLLAEEGAVIVPRLQFNWRHARPRTRGRVVSYHTRGAYDPRRLHVQESTLFGYCSFDHQGYAGFAAHVDRPELIEETAAGVSEEELEANFRDLQRRYVGERISKYAQPDERFEHDGPYVFVALQVLTDEVAQLAFVDMLTMLRTVAKAHAGTGVRVVVKRHPYCQSRHAEKTLRRLERRGAIVVSNASIHSLIEGAQVVYTVNSGVGLEALLHEKPVVVTGKCEYMYAATVARTAKALFDVARRGELEPSRGRAQALFYYAQNVVLVAPEARNGGWRAPRRFGADAPRTVTATR